MALPALIIPAISLVSTIFKGWLGAKKVKAEGKAKIAQAVVDAKIRKIDNQSTMDVAAANDMKHSWKDEYLVILMSIPVAMCFIPGLSEYALRGFKVLSETPEWYRWAFLGIIAASFGLRTWLGKLTMKG